MEVSYRRHFSNSYMLWKEENFPRELLELNVLAYNQIPGLLKVEMELADGELRYWYDITGMQSLSDYLKRKSVDFRMLEKIMSSLEQVCEEMTCYLLEEKNLVLNLDYVYLNLDKESIYFPYLPGSEKDLRTSFQELMEILLQKLSHEDKKAVAVAYDLYQMSLSTDKTLKDMLCRVLNQNTPEVLAPEEETTEGPEILQELPRKEGSWWKQRFTAKVQKVVEGPVDITEDVEEEKYPTELLSQEGVEQGLLMYQGLGRQQNLRIQKDGFLIGKRAKEVDGLIENKTVSRIHARIEVEEGIYYIEDMNSTNGTYVNGERLEYRQKVRLYSRDRVTFGEEDYLFL